jgi:hypothetical protein
LLAADFLTKTLYALFNLPNISHLAYYSSTDDELLLSLNMFGAFAAGL